MPTDPEKYFFEKRNPDNLSIIEEEGVCGGAIRGLAAVDCSCVDCVFLTWDAEDHTLCCSL